MIRWSGRNAFAAEGGALKRRLDAAVFVKFITGAGKANLSGLVHE